MKPETELNLEHLINLLSAYRNDRYNLTNDGWEKIDADTEKYYSAIHTLSNLLEEYESNDSWSGDSN